MPADAARLHIAEVEVATAETLIVVARCQSGVVRTGTRFRQIHNIAEPIELTVTELWRYSNRQVEAIDPPHAARVTLTGTGGELVRPGHLIQEITQAKP
jgi:hypothetical protein